MKQFVIILTFLLTSISGYCDTVDYWHVYINDALIAKFDVNSKELKVDIKKNELKSSDVITVRYGSDHPCLNCYYGLTVFAEMKRKAPVAYTNEHFGKLSIPIKDLFDIQKTDDVNRFYFNYYEGTNRYYAGTDQGPQKNERLLFVLTIN